MREVSDPDMDRLIRRISGAGWQAAPYDMGTVVGCYQSVRDAAGERSTITLRRSLADADRGIVFAHEYGHFVWHTILTGRMRARYARVWRGQRYRNRLVTAYAGENCEEGFAEAFAYYVCKPAVLRRIDSASWRYLAQLRLERARPTATADDRVGTRSDRK